MQYKLLVIRADYRMRRQSVEEKKADRFRDAWSRQCNEFIDRFPGEQIDEERCRSI